MVDALRPLPRLHGVRDGVSVGRALRPADRAGATAGRAQPRPLAGASGRCGGCCSRRSRTPSGCARWRRCSRPRASSAPSGSPSESACSPRSPRAPRCAGRRSAVLPERTPAVGAQRGRVGLLLGCVQRVFYPDVHRATIAALAAEGFEVLAPAPSGLLRRARAARRRRASRRSRAPVRRSPRSPRSSRSTTSSSTPPGAARR